MKFFIFLVLITTHTLYALVAIAPVDIGAKEGLSGKVEAGFETKRGNTDKDNYQASLRLLYDEGQEYVAWGEISLEYGQSNARKDTNKAFSHARYIHALLDRKDLVYELFTQLESDEFRKIHSRLLLGAGIRYRFFNNTTKGKGYFGLSAFHEYIDYTNSNLNPLENNQRLNSYIAYSVNFSQSSKFSASIYYQPKVHDFKDYIQTNSIELNFKIYKQLLLKLSTIYNIDTKPPSGVKEVDFTQRVTFIYDF
ncbi:DUF481 domain-containing protein [Sulfurimonas aquatica]|uniref:DUF481 domain-containing protein n=1 Tax=Sulfurimonas aquatica TaxID=2672570 RepID=A0A975GDY3_9BACT|nr:DUF481 domain-containing protein [Sulfurimonas aquatica]